MDKIFRKAPEFKGKLRIARWIYRSEIENRKNFWVEGKSGCKYYLPNLIENISFEIFANGVFEKEISDFLIKKMPSNGVFLDLGANIGTISIPLIQKRKDIKAVCVEAAPWIFSYLEKNLDGNNMRDVAAINKVLFYTDEEEVDFYSPADKFGKGSMSPVFTSESVKVKTIKVDSLVKELGLTHVDMIKIDVEGYEYHVFSGATDLLSRNDAPDILFEFADWAEERAKGIEIGAAQEILLKMGYSIYRFQEQTRNMTKIDIPLKKGFMMLFATKKHL